MANAYYVAGDVVLFEYISVLLFGLALGSFSSALIYRSPRGISWIYDSKKKHGAEGSDALYSACTSCGSRLSFLDLIPVFSWLFLRGKCRHCGTKISAYYPGVELLTALAAMGLYMCFGWGLSLLVCLFALPFLVALFFIDLEHFILPNDLTLSLFVIGLFAVPVLSDTPMLEAYKAAFSGMAVYALMVWFVGWIMSRLLKKQALGFGDVKFFAVSGLWLGLNMFSYFMIVSGIFGVLFALVWKSLKKGAVFPFGPALILAFYFLLIIEGSNFDIKW